MQTGAKVTFNLPIARDGECFDLADGKRGLAFKLGELAFCEMFFFILSFQFTHHFLCLSSKRIFRLIMILSPHHCLSSKRHYRIQMQIPYH